MVGPKPTPRRTCSEGCRICTAARAVDPEMVAHEAPGELARALSEATADELLEQCRRGFDGAPTFAVGLERAYMRLAQALVVHADAIRLLAALPRDRGFLEAALRHRGRGVDFLVERHEALGGPAVPRLQIELLVGSVSLRVARMVHEPWFVDGVAAAIAAELTQTARVFEPLASPALP